MDSPCDKTADKSIYYGTTQSFRLFTQANEIRVEGISNKVKLAGADLRIRRMEKFPDKQSSW